MTLLQEAKGNKDAVVIDVREPDEYVQGHVPGSINIPTSQINTVNYAKDTPLYLYCLSGGRSKMAMGFLEQKGFQNVNVSNQNTVYLHPQILSFFPDE